MADAKCYGTVLDFFTNDYWEIKACVILCSKCPVRIDCLNYAINENISDGIWGGVKGRTLDLLRDYKSRGRRIKQLEPDWTADWSIGGEWERMTGWSYPSKVGRPRGDGYRGKG